MRRRPETAGVLPPMYFIFRTISRAETCSYDAMNPSFFRIFAISSLVRLAGTATDSWRAPAALRTRVSMSATGSFGAPAPLGCGLRCETGRLTGGRSAPRASGAAASGAVGVVVVVSSVVITCSISRLRLETPQGWPYSLVAAKPLLARAHSSHQLDFVTP